MERVGSASDTDSLLLIIIIGLGVAAFARAGGRSSKNERTEARRRWSVAFPLALLE